DGGGAPTGSVLFVDGINLLGPPVPLDGTGTASFSTKTLAVGDHPAIAGIYSGDNDFKGSSSMPWDQVINKDCTSIAMTAAPDPSTYGQSITFKVVVTAVAPGVGPPTGSITLNDPINSLVTYVLGPVTLDSKGTAIIKSSILPAGSEAITAVYS